MIDDIGGDISKGVYDMREMVVCFCKDDVARDLG